MARKDSTIKNSVTGIVKYITKLIIQFVLRTIVIYKLGVEYVGLDSLYANIISMLSLAELGIGSAIVFSMYKPVAENDIEKLKSLNNLYKKMYLLISIIVLCVGLAIMPFIKHLINGEPNVNVNLYVIYAVFLANTVITYLGAHKRSLLFVYQRSDIENNIYTILYFILAILQAIMLLVFKSYYLYAILLPIFSLLETMVIVIMANKLYPKINGKAQPLDKAIKKEIFKNVIGASCHQIGYVIVLSTDNLLVSMFFGLNTLGIISNYILIYTAIHTLTMLINNALQASVGNLIATTDKEKVFKYFNTLNWIFACIDGFCCICLIGLYQHFMTIWVGVSGLVSIWVVLAIVVRFYVTKMRTLTILFKTCTGLMWNDKISPILESVLNIVISVICIKLMGIAGIFVGTIISTILVPMWVEPYVLFKNYFKKSIKLFFNKYLFYTLVTLIAGTLTFAICSLLPSVGIAYFILKGIICIIVICAVYLLCYYKTTEFKHAYSLFASLIIGFKTRNKKNTNNFTSQDDTTDNLN